MSEFVRVRIPETGAEWFCHPMTAEAHGLVPLDDNDKPSKRVAAPVKPVADQKDSAPAE